MKSAVRLAVPLSNANRMSSPIRRVVLTTLALSSLPLFCSAQNPLNGTWKVDLKQVDWSKKPFVLALSGGVYECKTCVPAIRIKADGSDQAVTGSPYYDTMAVEVVSDHQIKGTNKKTGHVVATFTSTVSSDGNTLTDEFSDSSATNGGAPVTGNETATRVANGPAGSHAISGSWRMSKMDNLSDNAATFTFDFKGNEVTMTNLTGATYTAKLDGSDAPMKGDPGLTSVSVQMLGKNTLQETCKRDGKTVTVYKTTLNADGKSAHVVALDKVQNRTTEYTIMKQ